jgi:cold shock CspA family protein
MLIGTVGFYNRLKGFGFISCPSLPGDIFVHHSGLDASTKKLDKGAPVEFELSSRREKSLAIKVKQIGPGAFAEADEAVRR